MSQQIEENSVKQLTLHWLYGLDEYFTHINHPQLEKYLAIKNALIHENIWKMQELAIGEVYRGPTENTEEFFHIIFSRLTGYENVTHRKKAFVKRFGDQRGIFQILYSCMDKWNDFDNCNYSLPSIEIYNAIMDTRA